MNRLPNSVPLVAILCGMLVISGCTITRARTTIKATPVAQYTVAERIPLAVELRLTDSYRQAKWMIGSSTLGVGAKDEILYGDHLVLNTEACAKAVFTNVTTTSAPPPAEKVSSCVPLAGNDALLVPRLVQFDIGALTLIRSKIAMGLEWTLYDNTGTMIWMDTVKGECGLLPDEHGFKPYVQKQFDITFKSVFEQSANAIVASPDIQAYARKLRTH